MIKYITIERDQSPGVLHINMDYHINVDLNRILGIHLMKELTKKIQNVSDRYIGNSSTIGMIGIIEGEINQVIDSFLKDKISSGQGDSYAAHQFYKRYMNETH